MKDPEVRFADLTKKREALIARGKLLEADEIRIAKKKKAVVEGVASIDAELEKLTAGK